MKLAFDVTSAVKPEPTGTGRYAVELLRALLRKLDPADRVTLGWRLSRWGRREHAPRFDDPRVRMRPLQSPFAWATFGRADVFHGLGVNVPRGLAARARCVTVHGVAEPVSDSAEKAEKRRRRVAKIATMIGRADRAFVVSEHERARTAEAAGCDPGKLVVVHHGVDAERFRPDADTAADRAARGALAPARPYLLYVGAITELKNVGRLLEAFACSRASRALDLVIAGPRRAESDAILARIPALGLGERVRAVGHVEPAAVPAWIRGAAAVVHPSRYESFGLPVVEAMACGTPVACSDVSALPEVTAGAALLFDPLDVDAIAAAVDRMAEDEALRADLRARGLARAAAFRWDRSADATLATYRALL